MKRILASVFALLCLYMFLPFTTVEAQGHLGFGERVGNLIDSAERDYFALFPKFKQTFINASLQPKDSLTATIQLQFGIPDSARQDTLIDISYKQLEELKRYIDHYEAIRQGDSAIRWELIYSYVQGRNPIDVKPHYTLIDRSGNGYRLSILTFLGEGVLLLDEKSLYHWSWPSQHIGYLPFSDIARVRGESSLQGYKQGALVGGIVGAVAAGLAWSQIDRPILSLSFIGTSMLTGGAIGQHIAVDQEFKEPSQLRRMLGIGVVLNDQLPLEIQNDSSLLPSSMGTLQPQEKNLLEYYEQPFLNPRFSLGLLIGDSFSSENLQTSSDTSYARSVVIPGIRMRPFSISLNGSARIFPFLQMNLQGKMDVGSIQEESYLTLSDYSLRPSLNIILLGRDNVHREGQVAIGAGYGLHFMSIDEDFPPVPEIDSFLFRYTGHTESTSFFLRLESQLYIGDNLSVISSIEPEFFGSADQLPAIPIPIQTTPNAFTIQAIDLKKHFRLSGYTGVVFHF